MNFREWLEWMAKDAQASDPYAQAYKKALKEFDRRFEGPHPDEGLWKGPIREVGWTEHYDVEEQGDE